MVKLKGAYLKHAVKRMYDLGLQEKDILKIFALYDTDALVDTLKYYKFVQNKINNEIFFYRLNQYQGWSGVRHRNVVFKSLFDKWEEQLT